MSIDSFISTTDLTAPVYEPFNNSYMSNQDTPTLMSNMQRTLRPSPTLLPVDRKIATLPNVFTKTDLDYEIFRLDSCHVSKSNYIALPSTAEKIVPNKVAEKSVDGIVWAATGTTGSVKGVMMTAPRYIKMESSRTFQEMWVVDLDRKTSE